MLPTQGFVRSNLVVRLSQKHWSDPARCSMRGSLGTWRLGRHELLFKIIGVLFRFWLEIDGAGLGGFFIALTRVIYLHKRTPMKWFEFLPIFKFLCLLLCGPLS